MRRPVWASHFEVARKHLFGEISFGKGCERINVEIMKHWLFIYREDREPYCDPDFGWENRTVLVDKTFPAGTSDWEILKTARSHEVKDLVEDHNTCSDGRLNRVLLRVIQIAREMPL